MLAILVGIFLFVFSLYIRLVARLMHKNFGIDTWYFLLYADEFRKNKKLPVKIPYYLLDDNKNQYYHPGFPILLSIFPKYFLERYHWLINPLIDSSQLVMLYILSYFLTSSLNVSIFAALLYITSPILISQSSNLNARMFGALILTLIMVNLYLFSQYNNLIYIFLAVLFGIVLFYSHKMSTQQFMFLALCFSFVTLNPFYIIIFILIFIFCVAIGRRFYLCLLKAHIDIIKFWGRNLPFLGMHQIYQSSFYKNLSKAQKMKGVSGLRSSMFFYSIERLVLIFMLIFAIYLYLFFGNLQSYNTKFIFYWIIINYFTVISTGYLPAFKCLGEGYKYLSYGVFPTSLFLSLYSFKKLNFPHSVMLIGIVLLINTAVFIYMIREQSKNILASTEESLFRIFNTLKELKGDGVLCFPFSKAESTAYFTRKKVLFGSHSLGFGELEYFWPVLKKPIEYFIDRYNIGYILVDDRYVDFNDLELKIEYKIIERQGNYTLMEIPKS